MRRTWNGGQLVVLLAFLVAGAALVSAGMGMAPVAEAHPAAGMVCVRIINAAAGATNVDVYFNGRTKPTPPDFAFGTVSNYWPENGGTQTVYVTQKGQSKGAAFFKTTVQAPPGGYYTLALLGDTPSSLSVVIFKDDPSISSGNARVRVYHLSPDADVASVSVGGQTVIPNVGYQQASNYLTIKPGTYTFDVAVQQGTKTVPLMATLEANKVTSIFGVGKVNATGADAFKFVVNTTGVMPANWPQTGFNPHPATATAAAQPMPNNAVPLAALFGALLLLLGGTWLPALRRRSAVSETASARK